MKRVVADLSTRIGIEGAAGFIRDLKAGAGAMRDLGSANAAFSAAAKEAAAASGAMTAKIIANERASQEAAKATVAAAEASGRSQVAAAKGARDKAAEFHAETVRQTKQRVAVVKREIAQERAAQASGGMNWRQKSESQERVGLLRKELADRRKMLSDLFGMGVQSAGDHRRAVAQAEAEAKAKVALAKVVAQSQIDEGKRSSASERAAFSVTRREMAEDARAAKVAATERARAARAGERSVRRGTATAGRVGYQAARRTTSYERIRELSDAAGRGPVMARREADEAAAAAQRASARVERYAGVMQRALAQAVAKGLDPEAIRVRTQAVLDGLKRVSDAATVDADHRERVAGKAEAAASARAKASAAAQVKAAREASSAQARAAMDAAAAQRRAAQESAAAWRRFAQVGRSLPRLGLTGRRPLADRLRTEGSISVLGGIAGTGIRAVGGVASGVAGIVTGAVGMTARLATGILGIGASAVKAGADLAFWLGSTVTSVLGKILGLAGQVAGKVASLASGLAKVALVGGAGLAIAGAKVAQKATADAGERAIGTDEARYGTGATPAGFQVMEAAAKRAGVEVSDLNAALKATREATLAAISDPSSDLGQYFERAGVQVTDMYGRLRSTDRILQDVVSKSRQFNRIDQEDFLTRVVGDPERYYKLSPLLQKMANPNNGFVAESGARAAQFGVMQGAGDLAQARAYKAAVNDISDAWTGVKIAIARAVGDDVNAGLTQTALTISRFGPLIARGFRFGFDEAQKIIRDASGVFQEGFAYADRAESSVTKGALYAAEAVRDLTREIRATIAGDDAAVTRFPWLIAIRDGITTAVQYVKRFGQEVRAAVMDDGSISNFKFPWLKSIADGVRSTVQDVKLQWQDLQRVFGGGEGMTGLGQWLASAMGIWRDGKAALQTFVADAKALWSDLLQVWDHKPDNQDSFNFEWVRKVGEDVWWMAENFKKAWEMFQAVFKVLDNTVKLFTFGNLNAETLILFGSLTMMLGVTRTLFGVVGGAKTVFGGLAGMLERMGMAVAGGGAVGGAAAAGGLAGGFNRMGDAVKTSGDHAVAATGKWNDFHKSLGKVGEAMGGIQGWAGRNPRMAGLAVAGAGVAAGVGGYMLSRDAEGRDGVLGSMEATAGGALQGAVFGASLGGVPGALIGGAVGGAAGYWTHRQDVKARFDAQVAEANARAGMTARERLQLPENFDPKNPEMVEAARKAGIERRQRAATEMRSVSDDVLNMPFYDNTKTAPAMPWSQSPSAPSAQPAPSVGPQASLAPVNIYLPGGEMLEATMDQRQVANASRLRDLKSGAPSWATSGAYA